MCGRYTQWRGILDSCNEHRPSKPGVAGSRAAISRLHAQQDSGDLYSAELRITMNDHVVLRELFWDEKKLQMRSQQLFERIVETFS